MLRAAVAIVLVLTTAVHAQPKTEADRLWEQGRALMEQKKFAEACDKFRASIAIDPAIGTQLNLGACLEKLGRRADAWRLYDAAADSDKQYPDRAKHSREVADALLPSLGTVVLTIAEPDAPALTITVAGRTVRPYATIREIVDPGDIKVTRVQTGAPPYERTVHVEAGGEAEITVPVPAARDSDVVEPPVVGETRHRRRSRVLLAYGVGGAGVVALGASIAVALKANSDYDSHIGAGKCTGSPPDCHGNDAEEQGLKDAISLGNVGTVLGVAGVALIGVGATLWLTAPKDVLITPTATSESAGISVVGRF